MNLERKTDGVKSGHGVHVDDLEAGLNPVHSRDLEIALAGCPESRRVPVAMAWADLPFERWADASGLHPVMLRQWTSHGPRRLPFGAAVRMARVLGVDPILLFASHL